LNKNKIPLCSKCGNLMVIIFYCIPNEIIEKFVNEKKIFYGGLELKNSNRENKLIYHCYNCNMSYSRNMKIKKYQVKVKYPYEQIEKIISNLADKVIDTLKSESIENLKKKSEYEHFGLGLYIRNNFIYNNDEIPYRIDADDISSLVFYKIIEKIK